VNREAYHAPEYLAIFMIPSDAAAGMCRFCDAHARSRPKNR
jgi:hypothetical protein